MKLPPGRKVEGARRRAQARLLPALLAAALAASGCLGSRPTEVPIPTLRFEPHGGGRRCLVVLLPGRWDRPEDFRDEGFVADLRASGAACDAVAVDAHLGYYRNRTVVERLHRDVVAPARAAGYEEIWLAGISLGGVGSLFYLRDHPGEIAGALLLAPYLGEPEVIREIAAGGGPARWTPPAEPADDDVGRILWSWLRQALTPAGGAALPALPPLYLGYGTGDDFAEANGLLAGLLPRERVFAVPGGHDWPPWREVWRAFLASGALPGTRLRQPREAGGSLPRGGGQEGAWDQCVGEKSNAGRHNPIEKPDPREKAVPASWLTRSLLNGSGTFLAGLVPA